VSDYYIERTLALAHEVSTLISQLALANRALEEANQSITELHAEFARRTSSALKLIDELNAANARIAQLEAELRELGDKAVAANRDGQGSFWSEYVEKVARDALEGKE
jgi:chromosome segregation ATPase